MDAEPQPEFRIRNVIDRGLMVRAASTDIIMRVHEGRVFITALAYDADRCPVVKVEPCWPTAAVAVTDGRTAPPSGEGSTIPESQEGTDGA